MLKALLISSLLLAVNLPAPAQSRDAPVEARLNRIEVFPDVARDHLRKRVDPYYPPIARQERIEGIVVLHVIIDKQGNVTEVKAESGPSVLRGAAIDAVKKWKYAPMTYKDYPVEMETKVTVQFRLQKPR